MDHFRSQFSCWLALLLSLVWVNDVGAQFGGSLDGSSLVKASVAPERRAIGPQSPTWLALRFDIQQGWHVYWKNPGDTGAPMTVRYKGPEWAEMGELHWPVPKRYESPGELLDFVHEGSPILLAQLRIDPEQWRAAGSPDSLKFELACEWFVCKEVCLLGEKTLVMEIPVAERSEDTADPERAALFATAREAMPTSKDAAPEGLYTAAFDSGVLRIRVPGASQLTFFPAPSADLALPVDALRDARKRGAALDIRYRDEAAGVEYLEGVLVIQRGADSPGGAGTEAVEIRVPVRQTDRETSPDRSGTK